jgi:hypothetical protein
MNPFAFRPVPAATSLVMPYVGMLTTREPPVTISKQGSFSMGVLFVREVGLSASLVALVALCAMGCQRSEIGASDAAPSASAPATTDNIPVAAPSASSLPSPAEQHRSEMQAAASDGHYEQVCSGIPAVPPNLCRWAAARAEGRAAPHPTGEELEAFFVHEHIKKVSGTILDDVEGANDEFFDVRVNGYRRHCRLETASPVSRGYFTMWVQEQPKTETVDLDDGQQQSRVVLDESSFAKAVLDLAHAPNGTEGKGIAVDLMGMIAKFVPYAELSGGPNNPSDGAAPEPTASGGINADHGSVAPALTVVPSVNVDTLPKAQP